MPFGSGRTRELRQESNCRREDSEKKRDRRARQSRVDGKDCVPAKARSRDGRERLCMQTWASRYTRCGARGGERERERGHVPVDVLQQTAGGPPISEMTPGQRDATPCVVRVDSATSSKRPRDDNAEVRICMFNRAEPEDRLAEAPVAGVGTLAVV